jgi:hypothetical protein
MSTSLPPIRPSGFADRLRQPVQVIVVSSVMFTFVSYHAPCRVFLAAAPIIPQEVQGEETPLGRTG